MKPLLILAPSPARWPVVQDLLAHEDEAWLADLRQRLVDGLRGCQDALAIMPESTHALASACIRRRGDIGVLGHVYTRPGQRQQGKARALLQALLSWFDMSGGKWLYATSPRDAAEYLFEKFGFTVLRGSRAAEAERVTLLRTPANVSASPFERVTSRIRIRDVARADWVLIVALLRHYAGPDPRMDLEQSALGAEATALELIAQQEQGACHLLAACHQNRIVGLGSLATQPVGGRTYAMLLPQDCPPQGLREAVLQLASAQGYTQVDFPMEALAATSAATPRNDHAEPASG
jgi:GNAT superfamily N-acetyltransferase